MCFLKPRKDQADILIYLDKITLYNKFVSYAKDFHALHGGKSRPAPSDYAKLHSRFCGYCKAFPRLD